MGKFTLPFSTLLIYSPSITTSDSEQGGRHTSSAVLTSRIVRKWDWSGHVIDQLRGHTDYVYSVAIGTGDKGRLLSCGEDHSAVRLSHTL
jgi:WD40 repeat protein